MLLDVFGALQGRIGRVLGRKWRKPAAGTCENASFGALRLYKGQAPQTGQPPRCSAFGCLGAVVWGSVAIVSKCSFAVFTYISTGTNLALSNHRIYKRLETWVYGIFGLYNLLKICTHRQLILASLIVAILACITRMAQENLSMMG
jgi:hypothetical protein